MPDAPTTIVTAAAAAQSSARPLAGRAAARMIASMGGVTSGFCVEHGGAVRRAEIGCSGAGVTPPGGGSGGHAHPAHRVGYRGPGGAAARATDCGDLNLRLNRGL